MLKRRETSSHESVSRPNNYHSLTHSQSVIYFTFAVRIIHIINRCSSENTAHGT